MGRFLRGPPFLLSGGRAIEGESPESGNFFPATVFSIPNVLETRRRFSWRAFYGAAGRSESESIDPDQETSRESIPPS